MTYMEAKIAIATVVGKAYFFLVNELKARGVDFLSLTPYETVPLNVEVVVTTESERKHIKHPNVLVYMEGSNPSILIDEAVKLVMGKGGFETIVVGVDPGKTFGIAVLSDGNIIDAVNCVSVEETVNTIRQIFSKQLAPARVLKVGNRPPSYIAELVPLLDEVLPPDVTIEIVREAGTSRYTGQPVHTRGQKHTMAAVKIAERRGQSYQRKGEAEAR
jgi:hypothetical protein